jgi:hypothetical protein
VGERGNEKLPGVKHEYTDEMMMEELFRFLWEEVLVTRRQETRKSAL